MPMILPAPKILAHWQQSAPMGPRPGRTRTVTGCRLVAGRHRRNGQRTPNTNCITLLKTTLDDCMIGSDDDIREVNSLLIRNPIGQRYTVGVGKGLTDVFGLSTWITASDVPVTQDASKGRTVELFHGLAGVGVGTGRSCGHGAGRSVYARFKGRTWRNRPLTESLLAPLALRRKAHTEVSTRSRD
jgi:hypothetical protein